MAALNIMKVVFFLLRMAPAIIFVLAMMILFFSFRVGVKENSMERFVFELSDTLASSQELAADRSLFSPEKLSNMEKTQKDIEQYAQNCDFGYQVDIESLAGKTVCEQGGDCVNFCKSVCNLDGSAIDMSVAGTLTGNCGCNIEVGDNFCQCKKSDKSGWQDDYKWSYGQLPSAIARASNDFPVGIAAGDTALPARMTITAYDSFLTRISCATTKAFYMKEKFATSFAINQLPTGATSFKRTAAGGTHVCLYKSNEPLEGECRYLPGISVNDFDILGGLLANSRANSWRIIAYPMKTSASCPPDASAVAGQNDVVNSVLLCMESE